MAAGKFCIDSENFESKSAEHFRGLVGSPEFADVTLVSQDHQRISAHRVILSSGCTFFRDVLAAEPSGQRPLLYLRGAASRVLEALVTFLYTGRAEVEQDMLQEFMALGEDLGVEGLVKEIEAGPKKANSSGGGDIITDDYIGQFSVENEAEKAMKLESIEVEVDFMDIKFDNLKEPSGHHLPKVKRTKGQFRANDKKTFLPKRSLDGTFHCPFCQKKVTDKSNMRRHVQRHQDIDFPCPKCDHIANARYNLKNHMKRYHEE
jgi:transcription elongation factor Elf1